MEKTELQPAAIPSELQIFDTYFPKWVSLSLAIDTAGLLIRIDRIVKGNNLLNIQPTNQNQNQNTNQNQNQQQNAVKTLYLLENSYYLFILSFSFLC